MWNYSQISKNKMIPFYSAIIFQLILQIFIVINLIALITDPIRFSRLLGRINIGLIGAGVIMAYITVIISINYSKEYWIDFSNFEFRICILSVIIGIIVGGFVLLSMVVP